MKGSVITMSGAAGLQFLIPGMLLSRGSIYGNVKCGIVLLLCNFNVFSQISKCQNTYFVHEN